MDEVLQLSELIGLIFAFDEDLSYLLVCRSWNSVAINNYVRYRKKTYFLTGCREGRIVSVIFSLELLRATRGFLAWKNWVLSGYAQACSGGHIKLCTVLHEMAIRDIRIMRQGYCDRNERYVRSRGFEKSAASTAILLRDVVLSVSARRIVKARTICDILLAVGAPVTTRLMTFVMRDIGIGRPYSEEQHWRLIIRHAGLRGTSIDKARMIINDEVNRIVKLQSNPSVVGAMATPDHRRPHTLSFPIILEIAGTYKSDDCITRDNKR